MVWVGMVNAHHIESTIRRRLIRGSIVVSSQLVATRSAIRLAIRSASRRRYTVLAILAHRSEEESTPFFGVRVSAVVTNLG